MAEITFIPVPCKTYPITAAQVDGKIVHAVWGGSERQRRDALVKWVSERHG